MAFWKKLGKFIAEEKTKEKNEIQKSPVISKKEDKKEKSSVSSKGDDKYEQLTRTKNNKSVKLRVAEALQDDAYKGIARIDFEVMKELGIKRGDVITIKGSRETVAIADRAYPADVGENIIRIDGIIRKNAKTGVSENVVVSRADVKEGKKVIIAPAQKGIRVQIQGNPNYFKAGLLGRAFTKGDIIVLGGVQRKRDMMSDDFGNMDDIFGNLNEMFGGMGYGGLGGLGGIQQIKFVIVSTNPVSACVITENTEIVLSNKAVEVSEESVPDITYEDIGGLTDEVKKIREMVEVPLKHPEIFEKLGIEPPKGVLLHGPPGTGKTLLSKAVANETEANFFIVNGPGIIMPDYHQSEKKLKELFEEAQRNAPSIIFIDDIDILAPKKATNDFSRIFVSQLLTKMDELKTDGRVIMIAATNNLNSIDPALLRHGRFDKQINIKIPDENGRLEILKVHTRGMPLMKDVNLEELAVATQGFVGADINALAKEAAMVVLRKVLSKIGGFKDGEEIPEEILKELKISQKDFQEALSTIKTNKNNSAKSKITIKNKKK